MLLSICSWGQQLPYCYCFWGFLGLWGNNCKLGMPPWLLLQVFNVCTSPIVQQAWDAGQLLAVHGLVYALTDGILKVCDGLTVVGWDGACVCGQGRAAAGWAPKSTFSTVALPTAFV